MRPTARPARLTSYSSLRRNSVLVQYILQNLAPALVHPVEVIHGRVRPADSLLYEIGVADHADMNLDLSDDALFALESLSTSASTIIVKTEELRAIDLDDAPTVTIDLRDEAAP